ncbi:PHB depolymerase family esterase [Variovorax sp. LARHSF232]
MQKRHLLELCIAGVLLAGCGGSDNNRPPTAAPTTPPPSDPVTPNAAQAISCPTSAALLTKKTLNVGGVDREYYESAPSNVLALREYDARGLTVVVNFHDANETGQKGAEATCWHEVGEEKGFITVFPSAVAGSWNTKFAPTSVDEVAFLKALLPAIKTKYALASNAIVYYTGVGQGGRMAQSMAMQAPQFLAAVASIDGTAEPEVFGLASNKLPPTTMSSWIINTKGQTDETEATQIAYWNKQNSAYSAPAAFEDPIFTSRVYASDARPLHQVKVSTPKLSGYAGKALTENIWDSLFAKTVRFFDDNRTNGTLHANQTIEDMKLIETTKEFVSGSPRRWLAYLPSNYAALTAGGQKLPLVISHHGRNGSGRWQAITSQWHEVGEKYGFIVVYPQGNGATWNTSIAPTNVDAAFELALIDELKTKYAVDSTRVFLNGASMGSAFTNRMAVQFPLLFAAIAPCYSGHLSPAAYADAIVRTDVPMPTWQCRGQDEVPSDFPGGTAGEAAAQVFWRETVNKNSGIPTLQVDGRRVTEIWNNGVAEYRWQLTQYQPHFWSEGQAEKIWSEMFSKYQRTAAGQLVRLP